MPHPQTPIGPTRLILAALAILALPGAARADDAAGRLVFHGPLPDGGAVGVTMPFGHPPTRVVVILPDGPADPRQNLRYADALLDRGAAVAEVGIGDDPVPPLGDLFRTLAAIPGLERAEVALLGLGAGGRLALMEGRGRRAALYPGCAGSPPVPRGEALLVHPRLSPDAPACEDLARAHPWVTLLGVRAGRGWDILPHGEDGAARAAHPDGGRVEARPQGDIALAVAEAVADHLVGPRVPGPVIAGGAR